MSKASPDTAKNDVAAIAAKYSIEVVGYLKLDDHTRIPAEEMGLLRGVKWAGKEVDVSCIKNPLEILPSARTMIILGKKLTDDAQDIYYQVSDEYLASVDIMVLDISSAKIIDRLNRDGFRSEEYTSYYMNAWAALAGLGWIGRSRMLISKEYGPRLRLKGVLTEADIGELHEVLSDDSCGECTECMKACPVGAISARDVDRKKCGSCTLNHRQFLKRYSIYSYCTACTIACPIGKGKGRSNRIQGNI